MKKRKSTKILEESEQTQNQFNELPEISRLRLASGYSLIRHTNTWVGDDIEECLQRVYDTRSRF